MVNWLTPANVCPGLFYGTPAQDGFLVRIRTPGGWLNHQQGRAIATFLEQWGSEAIQVTNRANLQVRSVHTAPTSEVFQALQDLGLAARNPSIDHLRNLMTSPTAGIDRCELIDTRPLVQALDAYIQSHPELAGLPAKFSIGIDGGGTVGIGTRSAIPWEHRYNEIQLSAVAVNDFAAKTLDERTNLPTGVYFRLALGADKQLCNTQVLIEPDDCLSVVAALATVYLDYVNQTPQSQKKPRLKHLLQDWGMEKYLQQVNCQLGRCLYQVTHCPVLPPTERYGHLGIHPQRQAGLSYIGVGLRLGQLTASQLLGLVQLSESFGSSHLRLTPWQTILLPDIPHERVPDLLQHLLSLGLSESNNRVDTGIVACAGKPGCASAVTQTQPHAIALADYLKERLTLECPVNIHLTGCAKSCAQPSPAEITLLGTTIEQNGATVEGYHVYVGDDCATGALREQQSFNYQSSEVAYADVPSLIEQLLHLYQQYRETPDESFGEFTNRYAIPELKLLITPQNSEIKPLELHD